MSINNHNQLKPLLPCSDYELPRLCKNNPRMTKFYQTTLEKLAQKTEPSDFKKYASVVAQTFTKKVMDNKGGIIKFADRTFLVRLKPGRENPEGLAKQPKIFVIDLSTIQHLGSGNYFSAHAVDEVISGHRIVLKCVKPCRDHQSYSASVLNEVRRSQRLLKKLNPFGITSGIQKKPLATIGLSKPLPSQQVLPLLSLVGTLEKRYHSELYDRIIAIADISEPHIDPLRERVKVASLQERLLICKQLLQGLLELHEQGYFHGDLKLENALIIGQGQSIVVHISDFGNAHPIDQLYPLKSASGTISKEYNIESDLVTEEMLFQTKSWDLLHLYHTKRDLFQMGVLLTRSLTASDPFRTKPQQFIDLNNSCLEMTIKRIWPAPLSEDLLNLLNQMLDPNPLFRPTAKEAFCSYMELIPHSSKLKRLSI